MALICFATLVFVGRAHAQAPNITAITPNTGGIGQSVSISGSHFGATQGSSTLTFNGTPVIQYQGWSDTAIFAAIVPAGATTGHIVVTVGGVSSATSPYDVFTVITTPYIAGLSGNTGGVGSKFSISGSNFGATQGTSTLTINGTPVTQYQYWTNTSIGAAIVPAGATTGYVVVTVGGASSPTNPYVIYTVTSGVFYYFDDSLSSSRVITDSNGGICYDADFYPFGGERPYTNTCPQNYKFTGKERDTESGLDNFGARYDSSQYGRFMSPDLPVDQHPADPQSWNLYSYVRNNPLSMTDPSGDYACGTYMSADQCTAFGNMLTQDQSTLDKAKAAGTINSDQYKSATNALGAYGTLNDGNGVTVNVGATGGFPGNTIAEGGGEKTAANPTGQDIQVTLNGKLFDQGSSPGLLGAIAHEGSHVEDAEVWAKAGFTAAANPTNFKTEFAAYGVTITMGQAQGAGSLSGTKPGGNTSMVFWNSQKSWIENQSSRTNMIKTFYPNWALKAFGENTKGSGK